MNLQFVVSITFDAHPYIPHFSPPTLRAYRTPGGHGRSVEREDEGVVIESRRGWSILDIALDVGRRVAG